MKREPLKLEDLKVGHLYRGKRFREFLGLTNDRVIIYLGRDAVQYDSHTVRQGRHFPQVTVEAFLKWASHEVEEEKPSSSTARTEEKKAPT